MINHFPSNVFYRPCFYQDILICLEKMRMELIQEYGVNFLLKIDKIMVEISNIPSLVCDQVFSLFLFFIFQFCSTRLYREIIIILICYWETLNQKQLHSKISEQSSIDEEPYCKIKSAEEIPNHANSFIIEFFFKCVSSGVMLE